MSSEPQSKRLLRGPLRWILVVAVVCVATHVLFGLPSIRAIVAAPLYVHDTDARGEAAYVMADGPAYWQRLRTASNLFHMKRVPMILLPDEKELSGYSFARERNESKVERARQYLQWHGVPRDRIGIVPFDSDVFLGSLGEAKSVARTYPELSSIVVVTSAMHTRRSRTCFDRSLPASANVSVYAASSPGASWNIRAPIWLEYAKLAAYYVFA